MIESPGLVTLLKQGDEPTIRKVYDGYKDDFIHFAQRYLSAGDELVDCYQDAMIILCEHAVQGKLDNLKSSIKTYLFSIGKYTLMNRLRKRSKMSPIEDCEIPEVAWEVYDEEHETERLVNLQAGFNKLGEQCQKVLKLFYYEGKKLDEIQQLLGYTNKDVLKSQKSRCIKQLRDLITNK